MSKATAVLPIIKKKIGDETIINLLKDNITQAEKQANEIIFWCIF
jgi:hypothetical protein